MRGFQFVCAAPVSEQGGSKRPQPRRQRRAEAVKLSVLGSTGSIGRSALSLARYLPERLKISALAAKSNVELLAAQVRLFNPSLVSVHGEDDRQRLFELLRPGEAPQVEIGAEGLDLVAAASGADTVLSAIVGAAGLAPTWAAAKAGLKVALANKESLVLAGELLMPVLKGKVAPVDSEHSAIFQALGGRLGPGSLRRVILTASGGPFRGWGIEKLEKATPEMALKHPTWAMGPKISVDSATLMNKGLEIIEAHHLFGLDYDDIEVVVQPGSVIHSLAEFEDGSQLAQLGPADMRLAIAYALSHPDRWPLLRIKDRPPKRDGSEMVREAAGLADFSRFKPFELSGSIPFEKPDLRNFPCLSLAEAAGRTGGTAPAVLNGANEAAVEAFLAGRLPFMKIAEVVGWCLDHLAPTALRSIEDALAVDAEARSLAKARIRTIGKTRDW